MTLHFTYLITLSSWMLMTLHYSPQINVCLKQVYVNITTSWLTDNGLIVNPSRSNSMIIGTKQRTNKPNSLLKIKINNSIIDQTNSFKLLGVEIDNNLTWNNHASQIAKRLSSKIGLINVFSKHCLVMLFTNCMPPYSCHKLIIVSLCGELFFSSF